MMISKIRGITFVSLMCICVPFSCAIPLFSDVFNVYLTLFMSSFSYEILHSSCYFNQILIMHAFGVNLEKNSLLSFLKLNNLGLTIFCRVFIST